MRRARRRATPSDVPEPAILYNSANEKSQLAQLRIEQVLRRVAQRGDRAEPGRQRRAHATATRPFELQPHDVAPSSQRHAAVWSKILPFVVFIWALTGAFYPAVDLCAGEKERGTLETLLTSPALRSEIVWGKLLTVMTFSIATALLNLVEHGRHRQVRHRPAEPGVGVRADKPLSMPPLASLLWLAVALVPMSALFSALVPGVCGVCPQHEGRPVLPDAAGAGEHAADDAADVAGRRAESGQQPDSAHRRGAAAAQRDRRAVPPGAGRTSRRWRR